MMQNPIAPKLALYGIAIEGVMNAAAQIMRARECRVHRSQAGIWGLY
jgi:hypothetical protein